MSARSMRKSHRMRCSARLGWSFLLVVRNCTSNYKHSIRRYPAKDCYLSKRASIRAAFNYRTDASCNSFHLQEKPSDDESKTARSALDAIEVQVQVQAQAVSRPLAQEQADRPDPEQTTSLIGTGALLLLPFPQPSPPFPCTERCRLSIHT